jgi:hypothetical protein
MSFMKLRIAILITVGAVLAAGQTTVSVSQLKCSGTSSAAIPVGTGFVIGGVPLILFSCVNLDLTSFTIDKTVTPWTLRATASNPPHQVREVPAGAVNGTNQNFTLSSAPSSNIIGTVENYPVMIYRNGLLLTACPIGATTGNCDYQISSTSILFMNGQVPQTGDLLSAVYFR